MKRTTKNGGRFTSRISWEEKLRRVKEPKIVDIPPKMVPRFGRGKMLIPRPLDIDALIRRVRKGRLVTQAILRDHLALAYRADVACPITTGIFVRIVAEAAEEARREGKKSITPYWRVVRDDGSLIEKLPGGWSAQAEKLRAEGHVIEEAAGRKPPRVGDFQKALWGRVP